MKEPIRFTDEEQYLISFYRSPSLSSSSRSLSRDIALILASITFLALHFTREDVAWGVVAYAILFYRIAWGSWHSRRWTPTMRDIISKYEERIAVLEKTEVPK